MIAPNYFHLSHNSTTTTSCVLLICSCIHDCLRHMREYHYYDPYFMRRSIADALFVYLVFFIFIDCAHQKSFSFGLDLSHMCFFYLLIAVLFCVPFSFEIYVDLDVFFFSFDVWLIWEYVLERNLLQMAFKRRVVWFYSSFVGICFVYTSFFSFLFVHWWLGILSQTSTISQTFLFCCHCQVYYGWSK